MPNGIGLFGVGVERCVSLLPRPALSVLFQSATKKHDNSQSAPCGGGGPCECMVVGFEAVRPNAFHTLGTGNFLQLEGSADADNPSIIPPATAGAPMEGKDIFLSYAPGVTVKGKRFGGGLTAGLRPMVSPYGTPRWIGWFVVVGAVRREPPVQERICPIGKFG